MNKNLLSKNCQRQLLLEYMRRYWDNIPDERMLDIIDIDVMDSLMKDIKCYRDELEKNIGNMK